MTHGSTGGGSVDLKKKLAGPPREMGWDQSDLDGPEHNHTPDVDDRAVERAADALDDERATGNER